MNPTPETHEEIIEEMFADWDAADERARVAEEARLHRIRKAREHLEATLAKRAVERRSKNVSDGANPKQFWTNPRRRHPTQSGRKMFQIHGRKMFQQGSAVRPQMTLKSSQR
jgi:hypothetical protein